MAYVTILVVAEIDDDELPTDGDSDDLLEVGLNLFEDSDVVQFIVIKTGVTEQAEDAGADSSIWPLVGGELRRINQPRSEGAKYGRIKDACPCGEKSTHYTIDGLDSKLCCAVYPQCMVKKTRRS